MLATHPHRVSCRGFPVCFGPKVYRRSFSLATLLFESLPPAPHSPVSFVAFRRPPRSSVPRRNFSSPPPRIITGHRRTLAAAANQDMEHTVQDNVASASSVQDKATAPYAEQTPEAVDRLCSALENAAKDKKKAGFSAKKNTFSVAGSRDALTVDSWKFQEHDYKKRDLPTFARGLFTTRTRNNVPEIAIRGYDKFFNVGEVGETRWNVIETQTTGPYELTLKENGCIIFMSGLEDGTLLVCSKHSTGDRSDVELSHAAAGQRWVERQLQALGRTKEELARELRVRNVTAVAELCDDDFEEHILPYGPDKAGLYLHGINVNIPEFMTYPSALVHQFADEWGFRKVGVIKMDTITEVRKFLEECAETGAHEGRDVEGFVIRCKRSSEPSKAQHSDWFFKYKFEEPYLMYRQWRECTKALIAGKPPRFKKHRAITEEYLVFAKRRLSADPNLGKLYNQNHGIIALRNDFLSFKKIGGVDAAKFEEIHGNSEKSEVDRDVILVPIATIGCGKTTIAVALSKLFRFGHVQNDNITGKNRPPRFTKMVLEQLEDHPAVTADRNNAEKRERNQIITDVKMQHSGALLVALNFVHDNIDKVREVAQGRVFARGDNHQTIQAATNLNKVKGIMEAFLKRFEPLDMSRAPDDGFDAVIHLDPLAGSRRNLETTVNELHHLYPKLVQNIPSTEEMDLVIQQALEEYRPDLRHTIPDRNKTGRDSQNGALEQPQKKAKKKPLEYMSINVPRKVINVLLEKTFKDADPDKARFYKQLLYSRRIQTNFHVTLIHRAIAKQQRELWDRYSRLQAEAEAKTGIPDSELGEVEVVLERVVHDSRIMAIVVRLNDPEGKWHCANKVAHVTIGTRDGSVMPKESNRMLERWISEGAREQTGIVDIVFEGRPSVKGIVKPVMSRSKEVVAKAAGASEGREMNIEDGDYL